MTHGDIAELRAACTEPNQQPFVDFKDEVLRVLAEREALLKAVAAYRAIVEGPTPSKERAVIAYESLCTAVEKAAAP